MRYAVYLVPILMGLGSVCVFAAGPFDGAWKGTAQRTTGAKCSKTIDFAMQVADSMAKGTFVTAAGNKGDVAGKIPADGGFNGTITGDKGSTKLPGKFAGSSFSGTFTFFECAYELTMTRG